MTTSEDYATAAGIDVRHLMPDRWPEYKALRLRALQSDPQAFGSSYQREAAFTDVQWQQRLAEHQNRRSWTYFAEDGEHRLLGMVSGFRDDHDLGHHSVHIYAMFVDKAARGRGVARALMARLLEEFSRDGDIRTAILEVNTEQEAARKLYKSFGFEVQDTYQQMMGDGREHRSSRMEM
jgi:ribosomal protein S18 acetylase RimI-like enzyme